MLGFHLILSYAYIKLDRDVALKGLTANHISHLMGHEDNNIALDVHSSGLAIELLVESINNLHTAKK